MQSEKPIRKTKTGIYIGENTTNWARISNDSFYRGTVFQKYGVFKFKGTERAFTFTGNESIDYSKYLKEGFRHWNYTQYNIGKKVMEKTLALKIEEVINNLIKNHDLKQVKITIILIKVKDKIGIQIRTDVGAGAVIVSCGDKPSIVSAPNRSQNPNPRSEVKMDVKKVIGNDDKEYEVGKEGDCFAQYVPKSNDCPLCKIKIPCEMETKKSGKTCKSFAAGIKFPECQKCEMQKECAEKSPKAKKEAVKKPAKSNAKVKDVAKKLNAKLAE